MDNKHIETYNGLDDPLDIPRVAGSGILVLDQDNPNPDKLPGVAQPANDEDMNKELTGYTNPDLHRRVEDKPTLGDDMISKSYTIQIVKKNSYRSTDISYHCEEEVNPDGTLNDNEIP